MDDLAKQSDAIQTREDFVAFVRQLSHDYEKNPEQWENDNLGTYLEALAAWVDDMDGYYQFHGEPMPTQPDWAMLGHILLAATIYE